MGKASSSKKVARAASTGGGRTAGTRRPVAWYTSLALIVLLGTALVVFSRSDRRAEVAAGQTKVPPFEQGSPKKPQGDHFHAALGVYHCDTFLPHLEDNGRDPDGIHTHGDGVIHIHPFNRRAAGENATLGVYEKTMGIEFGQDRIKYAGKTYEAGEDKCGKEDGVVKLFVNGKEVEGDPSDHAFSEDRQLIVVAFVPADTDEVPDPPSKGQLDNLEDLPNQGGIEGPAADTPTTEQEGETSDTTAPSEDPTTTAPATTDTTGG